MATHPALAEDVRPALALRFVLGIPTEVIARLFLVPTPTMAARLTRAKRRLAEIGAAFRVPAPATWPERVDDVAHAIYLGFTAGYAPGGDERRRTADATDAVRLAVLAADLLPGQPVLEALAALVLLLPAGTPGSPRRHPGAARRPGPDAARDRRGPAPPTVGYAEERLQALIAAFHATAATASDTDWAGIARAYRRLEQLTGSPIVRLNRAVAVGEGRGGGRPGAAPRGGERLPGHHRVALVRAELLARDGRVDEAAAAYREALAAVGEGAERNHIALRLARLEGRGGP